MSRSSSSSSSGSLAAVDWKSGTSQCGADLIEGQTRWHNRRRVWPRTISSQDSRYSRERGVRTEASDPPSASSSDETGPAPALVVRPTQRSAVLGTSISQVREQDREKRQVVVLPRSTRAKEECQFCGTGQAGTQVIVTYRVFCSELSSASDSIRPRDSVRIQRADKVRWLSHHACPTSDDKANLPVSSSSQSSDPSSLEGLTCSSPSCHLCPPDHPSRLRPVSLLPLHDPERAPPDHGLHEVGVDRLPLCELRVLGDDVLHQRQRGSVRVQGEQVLRC